MSREIISLGDKKKRGRILISYTFGGQGDAENKRGKERGICKDDGYTEL